MVAADSRSLGPRAGNTDEARHNSFGFVEQAMRGKEQFNASCSSCHGEDLGGRAEAPPLLGDMFSLRWKSATIGDLFDSIRTTMPRSSPGSLDRQTYPNIVAYLRYTDTRPRKHNHPALECDCDLHRLTDRTPESLPFTRSSALAFVATPLDCH